MPDFHSKAADVASREVDDFTAGYIEAIYFTETGDGDQPSREAEFSADALAVAIEECNTFRSRSKALLEAAYAREGYSEVQAGRDFWFTRNGHGVGYWDRSELDADGLGDKLTMCSAAAGEVWIEEGDDGKIYFT
jgi:hypothetical protein